MAVPHFKIPPCSRPHMSILRLDRQVCPTHKCPMEPLFKIVIFLPINALLCSLACAKWAVGHLRV